MGPGGAHGRLHLHYVSSEQCEMNTEVCVSNASYEINKEMSTSCDAFMRRPSFPRSGIYLGLPVTSYTTSVV